jgi:hypothetical protein
MGYVRFDVNDGGPVEAVHTPNVEMIPLHFEKFNDM